MWDVATVRSAVDQISSWLKVHAHQRTQWAGCIPHSHSSGSVSTQCVIRQWMPWGGDDDSGRLCSRAPGILGSSIMSCPHSHQTTQSAEGYMHNTFPGLLIKPKSLNAQITATVVLLLPNLYRDL